VSDNPFVISSCTCVSVSILNVFFFNFKEFATRLAGNADKKTAIYLSAEETLMIFLLFALLVQK
jgi:hypothetical protein